MRSLHSAAVFAALLLLLLTAATSRAETISADLDGDGAPDRVTATAGGPTLRIAASLSGTGRTSTQRFGSAFVFEPVFELSADVDGRLGDELFVHTGHITTYDTTTVLTVLGGALVRAGSFEVNAGLADWYAMGFRCTTVRGRPGIVSYSFARRRPGRWVRTTKRHRWRNGRLVRAGRPHRSTVAIPDPAETGRGCGTPAEH